MDHYYSPEQAIREREADLAALAAERARPKSLHEQARAIRDELVRVDCALARECGTYAPARVAALRDELAAIESAIRAEWAARGWAEEAARERRAAWNAWVRAQGSAMSAARAAAREREQGWTFTDLRGALAVWGLR